MHRNSNTSVDRTLPIPWFDLGVSVPLHDQRLHLSQVFSDVPGRVLALALGASYRSGITTQSVLGSGWTASWEESFRHVSLTAAQQQAGVAEDATDLIFHGASGREDRFVYDEGSKLWRPAAGFAVAVRRTDLGGGAANIELEDTDGSLSTYSRTAIGLPYVLTARRDRWGNRVTYTYGGVDATLSGITDDRGTPYTVAIRARADGQGRRLETLIDTTRDRTYRFAYTDDGARLKSVTVLKSSEPTKDLQTVTFGYQSSGKFELNSVTLPGDSQPYLQVSYAGSQVEKLTYGAAAPQVSDTITASGSSVDVIDTDGVRTRTQFLGETDRTMLPQQQVVDPDKAKITTEWVFNDQLRPLTVKTPTGVETWTWQGAAEAVNDRRATDLPLTRTRTPAAGAGASVTIAGITSASDPLTTTWTYESAEKYFQPLTVTDEQGVVTTYSYDRTRTSLEALQKQWEEASPDERAQLDTTSRETVSVPQQGGTAAVTQLLRNFHGQPLRSLSPAGALTQWSYYGESNTAVADQRRDLAGWLYQTAQTTDTGHQLTEVLPATSTATVLVTTTARDQFGRVESQTSPRGAVSITVYNDLGQVSEQRSPPVIGKTGMADPLVETPDGTDTLRVVEAAEDFSGHGLPKRTLRKTPVLDPTTSALQRSAGGTLSATSGAITYRHRILATTIARDGLDRPTTISQSVQGDNGTQEFTYLPNRERVQAVKGFDNVWTVYGFDTAGRQVSTTVGVPKTGAVLFDFSLNAVDQRRERVELDAAGNVVKRFVDYGGDGSPEILEETNVYDGFGRPLTSTKSVTGQVTNRAYDAKGRVAAEETLDGTGAPISRVTYAYDEQSGTLTSATDVLRGTTTTQVTDETKLTQTVTGPLATVSHAKLDGAGRTIAAFTGKGPVPADGAAGSGLWTAMAYDLDGNALVSSTGSTLATARGHFGTADSVNSPKYDGKAPWRWFNHNGQVVRERRPELDVGTQQAVTDTLPSGFGAPAYQLDAVDKNGSANGRLTEFDELGEVQAVREDGFDQSQRSTGSYRNRPERQAALVRYGTVIVDGVALEETGAHLVLTTADRLGRSVTQDEFNGSNELAQLDSAPQVIAKAIAMRTGNSRLVRTTQTTYDALGRVAQVKRPDDTIVTMVYFGDGPEVAANDRRRLRQIKTLFPGKKDAQIQRELAQYNRWGEPELLTEIQADDASRVETKRVFNTAAGTGAFGLVLSETTAVYAAPNKDAPDAPLTVLSTPRTVVNTYDAAGKRATLTYPSGPVVTYAYQDGLYLVGAERSDGRKLFHITLDADFRLPTGQSRWDGTVQIGQSFATREHVGLPETVTWMNAPDGARLLSSADYDQRGLVTSVGQWPRSTSGSERYTRGYDYDGFGRLQLAQPRTGDAFAEEKFGMTSVDNRTLAVVDGIAMDYTVSSGNTWSRFEVADKRLLAQDGTSEVPGSASGRSGEMGYLKSGVQAFDRLFKYSWDGLNRLNAANAMQGTTSAPWAVNYRYDAFGRRVMRSATRTQADGTTWTRIVYDGQQPIEEYVTVGVPPAKPSDKPKEVLSQRFSLIPGENTPVALERWENSTGELADSGAVKAPATTTLVLLPDHQGSVLGVFEPGVGLRERLVYNSTGLARQLPPKVLSDNTPVKDAYGSALVPFAWHGYYKEPITGRLHAHYRDYDALHGRWMSEDPMGMMDGWNKYQGYMGPNGVDPEGTFVETPWDVASAVVGLGQAIYHGATGQWGEMGWDLAGVGADTAAAFVPGVPGGVGMARLGGQGVRAATNLGRGIRGAQAGLAAGDVGMGVSGAYDSYSQGNYLTGSLQAGLSIFGGFNAGRTALSAGSSGALRALNSPVNSGIGQGGVLGWIGDSYRGMVIRSTHARVVAEIDEAINAGDAARLLGMVPGSRGWVRGAIAGSPRDRGNIVHAVMNQRLSGTRGFSKVRLTGSGQTGPDVWNPLTMRAWDFTSSEMRETQRHLQKYTTGTWNFRRPALNPLTGQAVRQWRSLQILLH